MLLCLYISLSFALSEGWPQDCSACNISRVVYTRASPFFDKRGVLLMHRLVYVVLREIILRSEPAGNNAAAVSK